LTESTPLVEKVIEARNHNLKFIYHPTPDTDEPEPTDAVVVMLRQFAKASKKFRLEQETKQNTRDMLDALDFWKSYEFLFVVPS
jgi:hypothetical protein